MPDYELILYEADPESSITRITLNRPDRLNALNDQMQVEIAAAVAEADADPIRGGDHHRRRPSILRRRRHEPAGRFVQRKRQRVDIGATPTRSAAVSSWPRI